MKLVAKVISKIFDPVVVIPLLLMGTISMAYLNGYRWKFFGLIFILDALLPGIYVARRFIQKRGRDWDIHRREERMPLFVLTVITHGLGVLVAYLLNRHPLAEILFGLWLLAVVYAGITFYWKISVHAGVNSAMAMMVSLFVGGELWWIWLIPILVGWARVYEGKHSYSQVVVGGLLAPLILWGVYQAWGII